MKVIGKCQEELKSAYGNSCSCQP